MDRDPTTKRFGLRAELIADPAAAATYERHHAAVWPEVLADGRRAGAIRTTIFRDERALFMVMDAVAGFDIDAYASFLSSPRTLEWQRIMNGLLEDQPGAAPGMKWRVIGTVCDVE
jgi:L-rhamnose mutarotase